jgi:hypothetical protein
VACLYRTLFRVEDCADLSDDCINTLAQVLDFIEWADDTMIADSTSTRCQKLIDDYLNDVEWHAKR